VQAGGPLDDLPDVLRHRLDHCHDHGRRSALRRIQRRLIGLRLDARGRATAEAFARDGDQVLIVGRRAAAGRLSTADPPGRAAATNR
jgi:hypothetical protein